MTSPDDGRVNEANGISLYVEEHGDGFPVLLLHGWPDSARLWRHQVPVLAASGYRVITPDMRGFGRSERPAEVRSYGPAAWLAGPITGSKPPTLVASPRMAMRAATASGRPAQTGSLSSLPP